MIQFRAKIRSFNYRHVCEKKILMFNLPTADPLEVENVPKLFKRIVWIFTLTISLWLLFYPKPYLFIFSIVSISIPALLVFAMFLPNGRSRESSLYNIRTDTRYFILGPLLLLSAVFSLSIMSNSQTTGNLHSFLINLIFSILPTIIFYIIFRKEILVCFCLAILLAPGLTTILNSYILLEPNNIFKGSLIKKYKATRSSGSYLQLKITPYQTIHLKVSHSIYVKAELGMDFCFFKQNGLLGIEILEVTDCPAKNNG